VFSGGHGSTLTALAAGTPAVIIPTFSERESNARRAAGLGAAVCLVPEGSTRAEMRLDPGAVGSAVDSLLSDPAYGRAAEAVRSELGALPGETYVADLVETMST